MLQPNLFFGNLFNDKDITTTRLANFAQDFIDNMTADNAGKVYDALIALVKPPTDAVKAELGDVASSVAFQKVATMTNDQVMNEFITIMRSKQGVIADKFAGGENAPEYLAFYPQGIRQYAQANKTTMSTLTDQVAKAAKAYAGVIGTELAELLQSYPKKWADSRSTQQQQKGTVKDNRTDRTGHRGELELALTQAAHTVGQMYPAQATKCMSLFSFPMLVPQTKHKHEVFSNASLPPDAADTVVNRTLTDTYEISIHNPDLDAPIAAWLAANEQEPYPGNGIEVEPGKTAIVKPSKLGDLSHTFLRVINLSEVNDGAYKVEIS